MKCQPSRRLSRHPLAQSADCGLALLHSHPPQTRVAGHEQDDIETESGRAAAVPATTGLPFHQGSRSRASAVLERPLQGSGSRRVSYERRECASVRRLSGAPASAGNDAIPPRQMRTSSRSGQSPLWGEADQANLVRLRGGSLEPAASADSSRSRSRGQVSRTFPFSTSIRSRRSIRPPLLRDHDDIIRKKKAERLADRLREIATTDGSETSRSTAVFEEEGVAGRARLRHPRFVRRPPVGPLYHESHGLRPLDPGRDGGISVRVNRRGKAGGRRWRAHVATSGASPTFQCLGF